MSYHSNFWKKYFEFYDVLLNVIPYQNLLNTIVKHLQIENHNKILDLGSGTGNIKYFIQDTIDITSLDYSKEALDRLSSKFPNSKTVYHSIMEDLPFEDNSFDRLVSNNVLYTLKSNEWDKVLKEIRRVVMPGGIVVISNINTNFNAMAIYLSHIKMSIKTKGLYKTIKSLLKLIKPTIQMMRYNKIIKMKNEHNEYSFPNGDDQLEKFINNGFDSISKTKSVYANQAFLDVFRNAK